MRWRLVQFSAVVTGQVHNPTILNPDFLANEKIVPKSWNWKVEQTVTTPPMAIVRYENGVNLTVEQNKLQVTDPNVASGPEHSKVTRIATKYVQLLPHVRYAAVGNNFQSLCRCENASDYMSDRFFKDGSWKSSPSTLKSAGFKFMYDLDDGGTLTLTLESGEARLPESAEKQYVLIANANFNRDCDPDARGRAKQVTAFLEDAASDWETFTNVLNAISPSTDSK